MRAKIFASIESGGGLLSSFVFIRGDAGQKVKHFRLPVWCVISCYNGISTHLLLKRKNGVYKIISTYA